MKLQIVPARTGALWVKQGMQTFFKQPLALAGIFFLCMAVVSIIGIVPVLGSLAALVFVPTMALALMLATHEATKGSFPTPSILLGALRAGQQGLRPMLVLGGLYAAGFMLVLALSALADGGEFARIFLGQRTEEEKAALTAAATAAAGATGAATTAADEIALEPGMLAFMALHLPLSLAFWHAPALVHWHGITPGKSLFFSLVACWRNKGAYTVFGLTWVAAIMVGGTLVQLLAVLLGQPALIGVGALLLTLLTTSMFLTSIYFTFRDSFSADAEESPAPNAIE